MQDSAVTIGIKVWGNKRSCDFIEESLCRNFSLANQIASLKNMTKNLLPALILVPGC